ncbi:hypothetical protein G6011_01441 [Alternaria panax]|uniref:Uncharacterized protein n=1 Tax=Alternaria panax TaxID=48097 RepID=A0AAD4IKI9_9PLEO|nr:hypothetical protein G6011_01441 [Alternaria panax]
MACNSWEKLCKAQRDYLKPKFADSFVQKSLKKTPKNPFLLARLTLSHGHNDVVNLVQQAWEQPGVNDIRLLSYLYQTLAEATRRDQGHKLSISGVGDGNLKVWQRAAKALGRKEDRQELWSALGKVALGEECWEDFRLAVFHYSKETKDSTGSVSVKKHAHFTQILAIQLAAEQQRGLPSGEMKCKLQFDLARRLLKQAYEAAPDDPIAFEDIRDLRFMGEIFARQAKCNELLEYWSHPPAALQDLMNRHQSDLWDMRIRLPRVSREWSLLESQCLAYIERVIAQQESLRETCAWKQDVWTNLLQATRATRVKDDSTRLVSDIIRRTFKPDEFQSQDRSLRLAYMTLRQTVVPGTAMLADCKAYWKTHANLITCYADIRPFVEALSREDRNAFSKFVDADCTEISRLSAEDKYPYQDLVTYNGNRLKLSYLIWISLTTQSSLIWQDYMEVPLTIAMKAPWLHSPKSPEGIVGIYILLRTHHNTMRNNEGVHPFGTTPNSRLLLQAAMLARHLVACDKEKQDRPLALLAARLHLNLGLGKCAFQLYSHTKCKEMLVHTLSPYVLSRISLTHPFGAKGYQGFSVEEELGKAVGSMERMERKIEDTIYADLQSLPWDQAMELLAMKRRFKSSLTKHICNIERRRISRLKSEPIDNLPVIDPSSYRHISDNVDRSVFPNYEHSKSPGPLTYIMPNTIPGINWLCESLDTWDASSRLLYRETQTRELQGAWIRSAATPSSRTNETELNMAPSESAAHEMWDYINSVVKMMLLEDSPRLASLQLLPFVIKALPEAIHAMRIAMEKLRMPGATNLALEDEPTMFHENMLISCYTKFEVLRALIKLVEHLREKVINAKTHSMKAKLSKDWVNDIETKTKICFEAIRDVAHSYIKLIETKGQAAIKAQIRWGKTGEILKEVLSDDDVEFYAAEYVDSALHAWKGVLQVKLR